MLDMLKNAASMKSKMKEVQKELAKKKVESSNKWVTVTALGDMSIESVVLKGDMPAENHRAEFERALASATNDALTKARKKAGAEMSRMMGGIPGLGGLMS